MLRPAPQKNDLGLTKLSTLEIKCEINKIRIFFEKEAIHVILHCTKPKRYLHIR